MSIAEEPADRNPLQMVFWRAAWHPLAVIGGIWLVGFAIGNGLMIPGSFVLGRDGLGTQVILSVAGALCGVVLWTSSVRYVNRQPVDFEAALRRLGGTRVETGGEGSVTVEAVGDQFGVTPASSYRMSVTHVDGDTVKIERTEFDTERRSLTDHPTVSVPRERLEAIGVERDDLSVRIDDTVWSVKYRGNDGRAFEQTRRAARSDDH